MRTKYKTRILLSLLTLVALFIGATTAFAAPAPTSTFTDFGGGYNTTINLTAEGTVDWTQCGTTANNLAIARKAPGTSPQLTATPPTGYSASASWYVTSWTDGAVPYATGTNEAHKFQGSGTPFVWTATVDPTGAKRLLKIWLRNSSGTSSMTAQIGADAPVAIPLPVTTGWYGEAIITFSSPTPTDVMTVTWTSTGTGNAFSHGSAALALAPANPNLYAYDDLNSPAGALYNTASPTGYGWQSWMEQNNNQSVPGYNVASANPLSYLNLATNGNYAVGGCAWEWAGRPLNPATFPAAVLSTTHAGTIGAFGSTVWISFLTRLDTDNSNSQIYFSQSTNWPPNNPRTGLDISGGVWEIFDTTLSAKTPTTVAATKGTTYLMVLKYVFGTGITLYVNPPSLGGAAPATPSAVYSTGNDLSFASLFWYPGSSNGTAASLDEIRMGATFADVTPVQVPVAPVMTSVTPAAGTVLVGNLASTVAVTFSEPVQGVGSITINGVPTTVAPVGSSANKTWTWSVPAAAQPAIPGTYNVTLSKTGITESLSGTNLPLAADVVWSFTIIPAPPAVYAYDGFTSATGPLYGTRSGAATGWTGVWGVQNNDVVVPGFEVRNATPLSYINLATSGNYGSGGRAYLTAAHSLNLAAFPAALKSGTAIGVPGQVVWMSALVRLDNNSTAYQFGFNKGLFSTWSGVDISAGKWAIFDNNGSVNTLTTVAAVRGATYMIVLKYEFAASNIVSLYVNPPNLGGAAPATPDAVYTTVNSLNFNSIQWYPGNNPGDASLDEVRIGNSFGAVTPVQFIAPAPPVVLSSAPSNGTVFTGASLPAGVSVTFDRAVTGVGSITVNGVVVGSPVPTNSYRTWTWPIPAGSNPNVPGTVINIVMSKTGITETGSGTNMPLAADYAFSYTFDPRQYKPTVALVSNSDQLDNHSAYTSFLIGDAYSTTLYTRSIQVEDVPGKYENMTGATKSLLQSTADLVIVLPHQLDAALSAPAQWNTLTVPLLSNNTPASRAWGWARNSSTRALQALGGYGFAGKGLVTTAPNLTPTNELLLAGVTPSWNAAVGEFGLPHGGLAFWNTVPAYNFACLGGNWGDINDCGGAVVVGDNFSWDQDKWVVRWEPGAAFGVSGTAPARRIFLMMGENSAGNNSGQDTVVKFFDSVNGANDTGAKQVLRNALRLLMNPDSRPLPLSILSTSPPANGNVGVLGPISVTFNKNVTGVSANDLTWNASSSGITYKNPTSSPLITVTPQGTPPTNVWTFDGPWETNPALINQFQPINITINALDAPGVSHIVALTGEGLALTTWTWNYAWFPNPASVSTKLWTLYE